MSSGVNTLLNSSSVISGKYGIKIFGVTKDELESLIDDEIYLRSPIFILVHKGTVNLEINFIRHTLSTHNLMIVSVGHFLKIKDISIDFESSVLYVDERYIKEKYSSDMIYRRAKYQVRLFKNPILQLDNSSFEIISKRFSFVQEALEDTVHLYQSKLILLSLQVFFLEVSSVLERKIDHEIDKETLSRDELYFQSFLELLIQNYEREHEVDFYARKINISTHYLTVIVKRLTGQTVSDFLYQLLLGNAKILLQNPNLSIKEISDRLNFSDQSAFGKFFKRRSGFSPLKYRRRFM